MSSVTATHNHFATTKHYITNIPSIWNMGNFVIFTLPILGCLSLLLIHSRASLRFVLRLSTQKRHRAACVRSAVVVGSGTKIKSSVCLVSINRTTIWKKDIHINIYNFCYELIQTFLGYLETRKWQNLIGSKKIAYNSLNPKKFLSSNPIQTLSLKSSWRGPQRTQILFGISRFLKTTISTTESSVKLSTFLSNYRAIASFFGLLRTTSYWGVSYGFSYKLLLLLFTFQTICFISSMTSKRRL